MSAPRTRGRGTTKIPSVIRERVPLQVIHISAAEERTEASVAAAGVRVRV